MTKDHRKLVKIKDAAEQLCVSQRTVWRLLATGALKPVFVGGATRLRQSDIDEIVDGIGEKQSADLANKGPEGR